MVSLFFANQTQPESDTAIVENIFAAPAYCARDIRMRPVKVSPPKVFPLRLKFMLPARSWPVPEANIFLNVGLVLN